MPALRAPQGWYIVGLMALLYVVSYVDRYILALIASRVAKDLTLTDTQLGVLLGLGFALLFCLAGLPIAHWLDRYNRVLIVAAGVLLWSLSTIASAFVGGFGWLLFFRAGVAMGEAVLLPATISFIGDLFDNEARTKPLATFSAIGTLMGGGAFFLGAAALSLAELLHSLGIGFAVWRLALIIVGAPGIILAIILATTVRDPIRQIDKATVGNGVVRLSGTEKCHKEPFGSMQR